MSIWFGVNKWNFQPFICQSNAFNFELYNGIYTFFTTLNMITNDWQFMKTWRFNGFFSCNMIHWMSNFWKRSNFNDFFLSTFRYINFYVIVCLPNVRCTNSAVFLTLSLRCSTSTNWIERTPTVVFVLLISQ